MTWKKWPHSEEENANSSSPSLVSNQISSVSLTQLLGQKGVKEQVTGGNCSVLQSIIGTSERLIAETLRPVYYCANSLKLSSCVLNHTARVPGSLTFSPVLLQVKCKSRIRKYDHMKNQKCEHEFVWPGSGPRLNTSFGNLRWGKFETRIIWLYLTLENHLFLSLGLNLLFPFLSR